MQLEETRSGAAGEDAPHVQIEQKTPPIQNDVLTSRIAGDAKSPDLQRATRFMQLFAGHDSAYGVYNGITEQRADGKKIGTDRRTVRGPVTLDLYEQHLAGESGLGIVPIRGDSTVRFGAIDIDVYAELNHAGLAKTLENNKLPLIVCRSKSGGAHIYCFTAEPVPAGLMVSRLSEIAVILGHGRAEIFPKQITMTSESDAGSWINLCYFNGVMSNRYAVRGDGNALDLPEFLDEAEKLRQPLTWFEQPIVENARPIQNVLDEVITQLKNGSHAGRDGAGYAFFRRLRVDGYNKAQCMEMVEAWTQAANEAAPKPGEPAYTVDDAKRNCNSAFRKPLTEEEKSQRSRKKERKYTPRAFAFKADGLYSDTENDKGKISSPIEVIARGTEGHVRGYVLVKIIDDQGKQREVTLGPDQLNFDISTFTDPLLRAGMMVEIGRGGFLQQYVRNTNTGQFFTVTSEIGWQGDGELYILPDESFGGQADLQIRFHGGSEHLFKTAGTLAEWQEHVSKFCVGNSRLTFAVSCAFAGPLLRLVNSSGATFHFRGKTSTGKSTALKVAGSVPGGGGRKPADGFLRSWNATVNGLESVAKLHSDALLCLDELGQADSKKVVVAIYMLNNGLGRERMKSDIEHRKAAAWSLVVLSSGEKSLADHAQEAGQKVKGGQEIRLLDIPADAGTGYGLFENIHDHRKDGELSPAAFAIAIDKAACQYYGTAFRAWLKTLVAQRATFAAKAIELIDKWEKEHVPQDASPEVGRAGRWFGLMASAGELATEAGITGWPAGEAARGAGTCFRAWLDGRVAGAGSCDEDQWIRTVRLALELYGSSRFETEDWKGNEEQRIPVRWGKRRKGEYWISQTVFEDEICKGLDAKAVAKALKERGYLRPEGKHLLQKASSRKERCEKPRSWYVVLDSVFERDNAPVQRELGLEDRDAA